MTTRDEKREDEVTVMETPYDWLRRGAERAPAAPAVATWRDGARGDWTSVGELCRAVDETAAGLLGQGVRPGDRVLLALPNDRSFPEALLACVAVGAIAVPAPCPAVARTDAFRERLAGITRDAAPVLVVTEADWHPRIAEALPPGGGVALTSPAELRVPDAGPAPGTVAPDGVALLQYTSGSTGRARGVVVTHRALRASCAQAARVYREGPADLGVTWVPLYHDMGLITGLMRPLYAGYPTVLLRPDDFARSPLSWLSALASCGGTLSSAPNFAFELCVRKVPGDRVAELDLSGWRVARNAGEMVRAETADRFARHFAAAGFRATAMCPSYGLAEATLAVTASGPDTPPLRLSVLDAPLERGEVVPAPAGTAPAAARELLSSGVPVPDTEVLVGDGTPGRVGPVAVRGPQLAPGRWAEAAALAGPDGWYRTSDLGFLHDGHLFVLGRADDTLVLNGRNHFLSDVVAACARLPGVRPGRLAPFLTRDAATGLAVAGVVAELPAGQPEPTVAELNRLARTVKRRLVEALELFVSRVVFVPAGTLPVTTSGKVRAAEVRRRFEAGTLPLVRGRDQETSPVR
ncbi:AMP-binding protein [Streptomyces sp. DSM 44915]|uniref:AMP-binding protein n=1 Tax=Streptomyces chisholmiae TaxID=3075540 RepID=A0ABU2JPD0_9ACTN|nr:AMP-binding protein [Streptomyces sp. DSM 44915]MDT0266574.1 AMP-binding protein [Streptomyces sp. DSM 44915]